jgi:hypothetical protein
MQIIKIKVADLSKDPANARKHDDRNIESIVASLRRFGQQKPVVIDMNNIVRAGNGTLEAAKRLGWDSIECVKTDLKGSEAIAYAIADNRTAELAEWNSDILAAQLNGLLTDDEALANAAGFSADEIEAMFSKLDADQVNQPSNGIDEDPNDDNENSEDNPYTSKVIAPIYEPKGECPNVAELYDYSKTNMLIKEIKHSKIPPDIERFLTLAAERHTAFHFRNIAEFYCHATPDVQALMEKSGLVIIDFNKAIEYGFVHLTERLGRLADSEEAIKANA